MFRSKNTFFPLLFLAAIAGCDARGEAPDGDRQEQVTADSLAAHSEHGEHGNHGEHDSADGGEHAHGDYASPEAHDSAHAAHMAQGGEHHQESASGPSAPAEESAPRPRPTRPITLPDVPLVFERPEHVRGIYLNAWASGSLARTTALIEMAKRTEINSFVIDIKDSSGYVSYATNVALAQEVGATEEIRIRDVSRLLERLHEAGIYPIARIVVFQDPLLAKQRPDLAIQDSIGGVWEDGAGHAWVNPYHRDVWDYNIALAAEAARLGFPEIQWDYVRFPDASNEDLARSRYPGQDGRRRSIAIREFLIHGNEGLEPFDVEITADVFGVATSARTDVGIGQLWEDFIDVIHVALPMIYPSHYWTGSFGIEKPNDRPYEIVLAALNAGVRRSESIPGSGAIRPWLQDFTLGAPRYGAPEVRAQIEATYDAGIQEWILWNSAGRYTEEAFAPAAGFPPGTDPLIRFGGEVVPASWRFGRPAGMEAEVSEPGADLPASGDAADTIPPVAGDTIPPVADTIPPRADTIPPRADTIPPSTDTIPPGAATISPTDTTSAGTATVPPAAGDTISSAGVATVPPAAGDTISSAGASKGGSRGR